MAKLRKGVSYRRIDRPYTRKSKYKKYNFVRATPVNKVVRFDMGDSQKRFPLYLDLYTRESLQLRHNAIESARMTTLRWLEKNLGKNDYHLKIRIYPHHILRENPLASGAGADRMSTGMARSFGKPIGLAAQVKEGQVIFTIGINNESKDVAKKALHRAICKLPCKMRICERK